MKNGGRGSHETRFRQRQTYVKISHLGEKAASLDVTSSPKPFDVEPLIIFAEL